MIESIHDKKTHKRNWRVYLALAVPLIMLVYVHVYAEIAFRRIALDMPHSDAIAVLGSPDKNEKTMLFCDGYFDWSGECPDQVHHRYLFFRKGIDRWIVIGLDSSDRVVFKTIGDI